MAMSASEAIKTFNVRLIQEVPLDNTMFFAMAKSAGLFPLDTEDCIMAQDTNTKKVTYLLRHVVKRGPDHYLPVLLQVMKDSGVSNVVELANDIEAAIGGTCQHVKPITIWSLYNCELMSVCIIVCVGVSTLVW